MPALSMPTLPRPRLPRARLPRPGAGWPERPSGGRLSRRMRILAAALAVVLVAALLVVFWPSTPQAHATAYFPRTVGLYPGSDVRILGVRVGRIDKIVPEGTKVRVDFQYDARQRLPVDVHAAVVSPSVVSDRYLQLFPVYRTGPTFTDGGVIPLTRTGVPVEIDRMLQSLDQVAVALGPNGANKNGALSRLLAVGAKNLQGEGTAANQTINDLSSAVTTLSNSGSDMFATVRNLQAFTGALAANDTQVRAFNQDLASVADQLDAERGDLAAALSNLATAMQQVQGFVRDNRAALKTNIDSLAKITQVLVNQKAALTEFLDVAPTALSNLQLAYNPDSGTLDTRADIPQLSNPAGFLCQLLLASGGSSGVQQCNQMLGAINALPKQLPGGPTGPLGGILGSSTPTTGRDLTLGGILEAK